MDIATKSPGSRSNATEAIEQRLQKKYTSSRSRVQLKSPAPIVSTADSLMAKPFAPIRWAIEGLVPEGVSLLVGAPKIGKSWLALQFALAITEGAPVWNGRASEVQGRVLMLALEDNDRRIQSRLAKLQAKYPVLISYATNWPRMDQDGLEHLSRWLEGHSAATRLVVIDTLGRFRPPESGRGSAYAQDYDVGAALKQLSDKHGVAILLLHHTRKAEAVDVLDSVSGTQGLTGSVDALLILRRERGQCDAALYVTGRDIEHEEDYALKFDAASCTWSALGRVHEVQRSRERQRIIEFLENNGPSKPRDIAEGLGQKGSAVRRLLQKLFSAGDVRLDDGRYTLLLGNSGNKGNSSVSGTTGTTVTPDTAVTAVTYPSAGPQKACARCDGEGCMHCRAAA